MASTYSDKNTSTTGSSSTSLASSIAGKVSGTTTGSTTTNSSTISSTANKTSSYMDQVNSAVNSGAYTFDSTKYDSITSAQNYLNQVISNKPGSYVSKYTSQLDSLYNQLMNRGKFSYNMNGDALYDQYRQKYTAQGKKSMRDTMGQAAANTGGYGSSYAQTAGQDAYNNYLTQLQETIPTLQSQAQERYNDETTRLTNQYNLANTADTNDYNRYRNDVSDWQTERSYAQSAEDTAYNRAYNEWSNAQNMAMTAVGNDRTEAANEKTSAQNLLTTMLNAGVKPSADLIAASGYSDADVKALYKKLK